MTQLEKQFKRFLHKQPRLGKQTFIAHSAVVLGDVTLRDRANIWYGAVLRGDINRIVIGRETNIQDNTVVHVSDGFGCFIGDRVTVGHSAIVHSCKVGNECLIGMGAVILDGAVIGEQCIIGAQALVKQGMKIPPGSMVLGAPARVTRALTHKERSSLKVLSAKYAAYAAYCLKHDINVGKPLPT